MPNPSTQDLLKGVDMTGIANPAAVDFNNLVDQATTFAQVSVVEGTGLLLFTKDTALNTPNVPNAVATPKWKRNFWIRIPFVPGVGLVFTAYVWNDANASDPTFLKWNQIAPTDLTAVTALVTAAQNAANAASLTANNAYTLAQGVSNNAVAAIATANAAKVEADSATAAAASANASATATAAQLTGLQTSITNATNTANAANTAAAAAQTAVTAFTSAHNVGIYSENAANNVSLGGTAIGANVRSINTTQFDTTGMVTLTAGKLKFTNAGTYVFDVIIPYVPDLTGATSQKVQGQLIDDGTSTILAIGNASNATYGGVGGVNLDFTMFCHIKCILVLTAAQIIRVNMQASATNGLLGRASNLSGKPEIYTIVRVDQIA